jgi:glyoxylase-like metal-dependent hydrolase (beta-lactamase superfamily II)
MATPEVLQLSENVYYLTGGVNAAIVVNGDKEAVFVDTGGDKEYGRNLKKACAALGVTPVAILNTHSHADHYGGNDFLVRNFNLPVYAPPFEAGIMENPYLEPVYLFGGAKPLPEMMSKWLLAKPSPVGHLLEPGTLTMYGLEFEIIDTSGHAHTHYAVKVGDVLLAADAVFGASSLERYPIPFGQDIAGQMESAKKVATLGAHVLLPGHGEPTEETRALSAANVRAFERAAETIRAACTGVDTATVLKSACDSLNVTMTDLPRYYLNLCTVLAYLGYLRERGGAQLRLEHNRALWHAL